MFKRLMATVVAAGLLTAPLPTLVAGAAAQSATPKAKRQLTPGQIAMHERQKKCGAEWRAAKKAGKIEKGMTWPKYWSACNKRLKSGG